MLMALLSKGITEIEICEALLCLAQLPTDKQQDVRLSVLAYVKFHIPPLPMDKEQREVYELFLKDIEKHSSGSGHAVADDKCNQG